MSFTSILEEEIDGLSLLHLSPTSIEELLSVMTEDKILKKPSIGFKTMFEKKLQELKDCVTSTNKQVYLFSLNDSLYFLL